MIPSKVKTAFALCSLGTILEWYDFSIFGALTPIISHLFFPNYNPSLAFFSVLIVFATGFLARPLGAILFGYLGDKYGRKISILISMLSMSLVILGMGLLPTYDSIGIWAPIILVFLRIFQGLSSSGEHTGTITYLSEIVKGKKYFLLSFVFCGVMFGTLLGSFIGAIVQLIFDQSQLFLYGWRLPFILGFSLGICGLYIRNKISESPIFIKVKSNNEICVNPISAVFKNQKNKMLLIAGIFCLNVIAFYSIFVYLPAELVHNKMFNASIALIITSIGILLMCITIPLIGFLCDKYGSYIFMKLGAMGFMLFTYPLFFIIANGNFLPVLISVCIFGVLNAFFLAPTPFIYTSLFPTNVRNSGVSIAMNISATLFGGFSPLVMASLGRMQNYILFQSLYIILAATISLGCVIFINTKKSYSKNILIAYEEANGYHT
jgi:MHS family proline/betaine transporter-like MFS transporter